MLSIGLQCNIDLFQQQFLQTFTKILLQQISEKKAEIKKHVKKNGFKKSEQYQDKFIILAIEILCSHRQNINNQRQVQKLNDLLTYLGFQNIENFCELNQSSKEEEEQDDCNNIDHNYEQIGQLFKDINENYLEIEEMLRKPDIQEDEFLQEMDLFLKNFNKLFEAKSLFSFSQNKKFQKLQEFLDNYIQYKDDFQGFKKQYNDPEETYNEKDFESVKSSIKQSKNSFNQSKENTPKKSLQKSNMSQKQILQEEIQKFCDKERNFMKNKISDLESQLKKMHQENLLLKQKLKQEEIKNESLESRLKRLDQDVKYKDNQIDTFFKQISQHIKGKPSIENSQMGVNTDFQKTVTNRKFTFTSQKYIPEKLQTSTFNTNPYYGEFKGGIKESNFQRPSNLVTSSINNSTHENSFNKFNNISQFKSRIQENQDFLNSLNNDINKILSRNKEKTSLQSSGDQQRSYRASSLQSQKNFGFQDQKLQTIGRISTFDRKHDIGNLSMRSNSFNDKENISSFRNSNYQNFQNKFSQGIFQYRNQLITYKYSSNLLFQLIINQYKFFKIIQKRNSKIGSFVFSLILQIFLYYQKYIFQLSFLNNFLMKIVETPQEKNEAKPQTEENHKQQIQKYKANLTDFCKGFIFGFVLSIFTYFFRKNDQKSNSFQIGKEVGRLTSIFLMVFFCVSFYSYQQLVDEKEYRAALKGQDQFRVNDFQTYMTKGLYGLFGYGDKDEIIAEMNYQGRRRRYRKRHQIDGKFKAQQQT